MKNILIIILCLPVFSLTYGQALFNSLRISTNTKSTALGGVLNAHPDENVNFFTLNPGLLKGVDQHVSFQHTFYLADISAEQLTFAHDFKKIGLLGFSLQYFNYGNFTGYDETGAALGEFNVSDFVVSTGYSHEQGNFTLGGNVKFAASDFIDYFASALLFDIGGTFRHPSQDLVVGLTFKNFGIILSDYTEDADSYLPFDVQLGAAYKPQHMPFRFLLNFYNLSDFGLPYYNERLNPDKPGAFDKIFSHISMGTELLINKNFHLMAGYNHLIRSELKLENKSAWAGISYGLEITVKNFDFGYSRAHYVAGKAINQIGMNLDLRGFKKTKI